MTTEPSSDDRMDPNLPNPEVPVDPSGDPGSVPGDPDVNPSGAPDAVRDPAPDVQTSAEGDASR